ncbi:putative GTP-binding protein 6 [Hippocampus comes]|uniref:putative GTP-binding protein 6 n=1 Tax=Hippocampus comes TaxID=109280 RepID=UPI00094E0159|nr:PREDICTED: putative GTP-binding protein 6 [Hippocampus comes]
MAIVRRIHAWSSLLHGACTRISRPVATLTPTWTSRLPRHGDPPTPRCNSRAFGLSRCTWRRSDGFTEDRGFTQQEDDIDEDEDSMEEEEEADELFRELQPATALPEGPHRLFVVHPDVKWGSRKQHLTTGEWTVNLTVFTNLRARGFCSQAKAMSDLKIMLLHHPSAKVLYRSKGRWFT